MFPSSFGQLAPNCGGSYCYVVTPGANTSQSIDGAFWAFRFGSPTSGVGADDGASALGSWLLPGAGGRYIQSDWTPPGVDGCANGNVASGKPAEILVAEIEDSGNGHGGLFAIAAARRFANADPEYDLTFVAGGGQPSNVTLVDIPKARVVESGGDHFTFGSPDLGTLSAGVFADASVTPAELLAGYRVFQIQGGNVLSFRKSAGWTAITGTIPFGQNVTVPWNGQTPQYYAYGLVFDSGFETVYVGQYLTVHGQCDFAPDADGDGSPDASANPECCPIPSACDCDDHNPAVHPGALEVCNGIDDDCDGTIDNVALPGASTLLIDKVPAGAHLVWSSLAVAMSYDVVRGDLQGLRDSGGDFAASTKACLIDNATATTLEDPDALEPGRGVWYLTRASNCTGSGSYDGTDALQAVHRDPGIAASGSGCP